MYKNIWFFYTIFHTKFMVECGYKKHTTKWFAVQYLVV